jgi:hypothetical protein
LSDGTISSIGTGVSLSESRGGSATERVESWGSSSVTLARGEGVVGLVEVSDGHDELTSHDIELVLTHQGGGRVLGLGGTDSETELVVRDERHPLRCQQRPCRRTTETAYLLVKDILAGNVRGDITSDRVSNSIGTVGVELSSGISLGLEVNIDQATLYGNVRCSWMYHPRNRGSGRSKES